LGLGGIAAYAAHLDLFRPKMYLTIDRASTVSQAGFGWAPTPHIVFASSLPVLLGLSSWTLLSAPVYILVALFLGYQSQLTISLAIWVLALGVAVRRRLLGGVAWGTGLGVVAVAVAASAYWAVHPFLGRQLSTSSFTQLPAAWMGLTHPLQPLALAVYALLPFTVLLMPAAKRYVRHVEGEAVRVFKLRLPSWTKQPNLEKELWNPWTSRALLTFSVVLAVFLALYNYSPLLNPGWLPSGVDVMYYTPFLEEMLASQDPVGQVFQSPWGSTRPLYLTLLYGAQRATGLQPLAAVELMPALLLSLLTASYYLLALRLLGSRSIAAAAAFFTATGMQGTVGLYASFQADMLSLVILNLLAVTALTLRDDSLAIPAIGVLAFAAALTHPWTTLQALLPITAATMLARRVSESRRLWRIPPGILGASLSVVFTNTMAGRPPLSLEFSRGPGAVLGTAGGMVSASNIWRYWANASYNITTHYGGFMSATLFLALSLIGSVWAMKPPSSPAKWYLLAWIIPLMALPLVNSGIGSRLYFNAPLQIAAALGLGLLLSTTRGRGSRIMLATLLLVGSLTYALEAAANTWHIPYTALPPAPG